MQKVKCRISDVSLKDHQTLFIDIQADQEFSVRDYQELKNAAKELGNGKKMYNLINVGAHTIPCKIAREMSSSIDGSKFKMADAFVIKSLSQKIVANMMLKVNKPTVPTRFFDKIEDAEKWLLDLRIDHFFHEVKTQEQA